MPTTFVTGIGARADEGALIGALVRGLIDTTDPDDLVVVSARDGDVLTGCIYECACATKASRWSSCLPPWPSPPRGRTKATARR